MFSSALSVCSPRETASSNADACSKYFCAISLSCLSYKYIHPISCKTRAGRLASSISSIDFSKQASRSFVLPRKRASRICSSIGALSTHLHSSDRGASSVARRTKPETSPVPECVRSARGVAVSTASPTTESDFVVNTTAANADNIFPPCPF